ncbi:hypothetical protein CMV_003378 [Castanea mollissima]|uniref:Alba DNA/RNA-binding protein n=1 Tax=Castanea mollissima TaxID=60419 RepID=A0A8J4RUM3_9ROSI|nr:hypothetical protein CMV_003378 [Castanea mollissima]
MNRVRVSHTKNPFLVSVTSPPFSLSVYLASVRSLLLPLLVPIWVLGILYWGLIVMLVMICLFVIGLQLCLQRYMQQHNEVELPPLGVAIATVVTIAEILKNNGLAVEKKIMTSTVDIKDDSRGRPIQKAKIEILLGKTENFDELMAAAAEEREAAEAEEQG